MFHVHRLLNETMEPISNDYAMKSMMNDESDTELKVFEPMATDKVLDSNEAKYIKVMNVFSTNDFLQHRHPMELDKTYRVTMFD